MEDMAFLWSYQENFDELNQKLLYTNLEIGTVRAEASEEIRKHKEYVKQSLQLLRIALQERDEARNQLHKLLMINSSTAPISSSSEFLAPQLPPTKANSSITESNSLSETYNFHSQNSSPVDSFFGGVASPELSNINNIVDSSKIAYMNHPFLQDCNGNAAMNLVPSEAPRIDQDSLVIDDLVNAKALPQKGKFLQTVLEAGPLLQTLLVAGPLPQWRNPPTLHSFHIPPVYVKGLDAEKIGQKQAGNSRNAQRSINSQIYGEMSCGSSQMIPASMLNFGNGTSGSCGGNGGLISAGANNTNNLIPTCKRQRFH